MSGINKPAMILRVVDLPVPEPPIIPTASPLRIVIFAPLRMALLPKDLNTFFISMRTSAGAGSCADLDAASERFVADKGLSVSSDVDGTDAPYANLSVSGAQTSEQS